MGSLRLTGTGEGDRDCSGSSTESSQAGQSDSSLYAGEGDCSGSASKFSLDEQKESDS